MSQSLSIETTLDNQGAEIGSNRLLLPMVAAIGASATAYAGYVSGHRVTRRKYSMEPAEGAVILNDNNANQTIITLVGHRVEAQALADLIEPSFGEQADTAYIGYSRRDMALEDVGAAVIRARRTLGENRPVSFYCHSFGGPIWAKLFQDDEFKEEFGAVDNVVFDSSPSSIDDVRLGPRAALDVAMCTRNSYSMNAMTRAVLGKRAHYLAKPYLNSPNYNAVLAHRVATAQMPLYAIAEQGKHLKQGSITDLRDIAQAAYYVHARKDNVIDVDKAFEVYETAFGGAIERKIDRSRPEKNHAGGSEHPDLVKKLLLVA